MLNLKKIKNFKINKTTLVYFLFIVLALPLVLITKDFSFIADDYTLIKHSKQIFQDLNFKKLILQYDNGLFLFRPIVLITFYINYLFCGSKPFGYYLFNVLSHLLVTILIFKLLLKLKGYLNTSREFALILSIIFFIIPQNLVNVLWISGRSDILFFLFLIISILFLINYLENQKKIFIAFSNFFLLVSILTKESALLIIIYVVLIYILINDNKRKTIFFPTLNYILIIIFYFLFRYFVIGENLYSDIKIKLIEANIIVKIIYSLLSFLILVDTKDIFFIIFNYFDYSLIYFLLYFITYGIIFIKMIRNKLYLEFLIFLLGIVCLLIYILTTFPMFRLMYSNMFFLILSLSLVLIKLSKNLKLFLILNVLFFIVSGNYLILRSFIILNDFNSRLIDLIKNKAEYKNKTLYYLVPTPVSIGQRFALPFIKSLSYYSIHNKVGGELNNFSENVVFLEVSSFSNITHNIEYEFIDSLTFAIKTKNLSNLVIRPTSIKLEEDSIFITKAIFNSYFLPNRSNKVLIKLKKAQYRDIIKIIYFKNKKLKVNEFDDFLLDIK